MSSSLHNHRRIPVLFSATLGLTLTRCAVPVPAGPTVMALPAQGESLTEFQQHDSLCRQYASAQIGGTTPGQVGAVRGLAGAAAGTGIGAASGALIGAASGAAGKGAAIGAGTGLLAGTLLGSVHGRYAAAAIQNRYNISYTQCMATNGERVPEPAPLPLAYAPPLAAVYLPVPVYAVAPPP